MEVANPRRKAIIGSMNLRRVVNLQKKPLKPVVIFQLKDIIQFHKNKCILRMDLEKELDFFQNCMSVIEKYPTIFIRISILPLPGNHHISPRKSGIHKP